MGELMLLVDNGIIFVAFMLLLLCTCLGIGLYAIYNIGPVQTEITSRDFADAFQSVMFIVGLIANALYTEARTKSTARPRMYDAFLDSLQRMTRKMAGIRMTIEHMPNGRDWRRGGKTIDAVATDTPDARLQIRTIAMYIYVMARYSYKVFQPNDPHKDYLDYIDEAEYIRSEDVLRQTIGASFKQEQTTNIFSNAILFIETELMHMLRDGIIHSGVYTNLATILDDITDKVHDINASMRIATPRICDQSSYAILFIYLVVLTPLQIYSNVSWWMMVVYPLVLFIYMSNILFGEWMGDPFISHPRFAGTEVVAWRHQLYAVIHDLLLRDIPRDDRGDALRIDDTSRWSVSSFAPNG
jgi:hypothetical protein